MINDICWLKPHTPICFKCKTGDFIKPCLLCSIFSPSLPPNTTLSHLGTLQLPFSCQIWSFSWLIVYGLRTHAKISVETSSWIFWMNVCMLWDRENGNITTVTAVFCQKIYLWVSNPGRGFVNLYWRRRDEHLKSNLLNFDIHTGKKHNSNIYLFFFTLTLEKHVNVSSCSVKHGRISG